MEQYHGVELDPPVKTRFAVISTPVAVFSGGRDSESTLLWATRLADQAPQASLFLAPVVDHFAMFWGIRRSSSVSWANLSPTPNKACGPACLPCGLPHGRSPGTKLDV